MPGQKIDPDRRGRAAHRDDARGLPRIAGPRRRRAPAIASRTRSAMSRPGGFDVAIIDVQLKDGEQVWPVADRLAEAGTPFVLATGGHIEPPPARHAGAPILVQALYDRRDRARAGRGLRRAEAGAGEARKRMMISSSCCRSCSMRRSASSRLFRADRAALPGRARSAPPDRCRRARSGSRSARRLGRAAARRPHPARAAAAGARCWSSASAAMPGTPTTAADYLHDLYPEARRRRLPLSRLSAERGRPGRRGAARGRAADPRFRRRAPAPGADRRRRLQRRQRRRRVAAGRSAPLDGLILVTPFDSPRPRSPPAIIPGCRCGCCFRHDMEPAADLRGVRSPVAILAGGRDTLIPARADRGAAPAPCRTSPSTGPSRTPATTTYTSIPAFRARDGARRSTACCSPR